MMTGLNFMATEKICAGVGFDKKIIIISLNDRPKSKAQKSLNWEDICRQIVDQL